MIYIVTHKNFTPPRVGGGTVQFKQAQLCTRKSKWMFMMMME